MCPPRHNYVCTFTCLSLSSFYFILFSCPILISLLLFFLSPLPLSVCLSVRRPSLCPPAIIICLVVSVGVIRQLLGCLSMRLSNRLYAVVPVRRLAVGRLCQWPSPSLNLAILVHWPSPSAGHPLWSAGRLCRLRVWRSSSSNSLSGQQSDRLSAGQLLDVYWAGCRTSDQLVVKPIVGHYLSHTHTQLSTHNRHTYKHTRRESEKLVTESESEEWRRDFFSREGRPFGRAKSVVGVGGEA